MAFTIDIKGLKELQNNLEKLPQKLKTEASLILENGAAEWVKLAHKDAPVDVGFLKQQITYKKISDTSFEVVAGSDYSAYMEFGTKGRVKVPPEFVKYAGEFKSEGRGFHEPQSFFDSILAWVKRKGFAALKTKSGKKSKTLESTIAQEQAAFAIYLSIARHGVKPHPFFFKQAEPVRVLLEKGIGSILKEAKL